MMSKLNKLLLKICLYFYRNIVLFLLSELEDSNLEDSNFEDSNLEDSNLEDSNLEDSNLEDSNLEEFISEPQNHNITISQNENETYDINESAIVDDIVQCSRSINTNIEGLRGYNI